MTLVGPAVLLLGEEQTDFGDFLTTILQNPPAAVVLPAINRDYSSSSSRGYNITLTGVQETLDDGTLWRWLWDHFDEKDVPIVWSPLGEGQVYFEDQIASVPDPAVGGAANQHGTFDITIPLVRRPLIVPNPSSVEPAPEGAAELEVPAAG